ncbi:hypothetical protein [Acetobacter oeni]|uniref:Uncharacterized protein n=1 Tax=Acetobacter oeni TaxID=304077 RepID=A0A511XP06_9PROT|nr:hypothetical protein [Acetobacter oeni]MBB3884487.1 hypothetical protein [Acetobacter oeni]NHO20419.1 hypothetical protein [Acetobacter oeni]GBR00529.1 hypothetical protein AA21952_0133 [Acetobacter oeni LMG 21952]GEN64702.1 hypothetical protein AOE01nite_29260 [Acetobacter oeni]
MADTVAIRVTVDASALVFDKRALKASLLVAGREVAAQARRDMRSSAGSGIIYRGPGGSASKYRGGYKRGAHQASAPGEAPSRITGTLAKSIKVRAFRSGEGVSIRDTAFYALFLEKGASGGGRMKSGGAFVRGKRGVGKVRKLEPRPFLTRALQEREASIEPRLAQAARDGIRMVRMKL